MVPMLLLLLLLLLLPDESSRIPELSGTKGIEMKILYKFDYLHFRVTCNAKANPLKRPV